MSRRVAVAAAQMRPRATVEENVNRIIMFLRQAAEQRVRIVAFPETAVSSYPPLPTATEEIIDGAEQTIRDACAEHRVGAIVGTPRNGFNSAMVIDENGREIGRHNKMQLVPDDEPWASPGNELSVFELSGIPLSVIVCHDKRYPELCRIPVLGGSRLIVYISAEAYHDDLPLTNIKRGWSRERFDEERRVYRAQSQARAVENRVWLLKSNYAGVPSTPASDAVGLVGSHGGSCIISPTGIVSVEAGVYEETLVCDEIDLGESDAFYAKKSLLADYKFSPFWKEAAASIKYCN